MRLCRGDSPLMALLLTLMKLSYIMNKSQTVYKWKGLLVNKQSPIPNLTGERSPSIWRPPLRGDWRFCSASLRWQKRQNFCLTFARRATNSKISVCFWAPWRIKISASGFYDHKAASDAALKIPHGGPIILRNDKPDIKPSHWWQRGN